MGDYAHLEKLNFLTIQLHKRYYPIVENERDLSLVLALPFLLYCCSNLSSFTQLLQSGALYHKRARILEENVLESGRLKIINVLCNRTLF